MPEAAMQKLSPSMELGRAKTVPDIGTETRARDFFAHKASEGVNVANLHLVEMAQQHPRLSSGDSWTEIWTVVRKMQFDFSIVGSLPRTQTFLPYTRAKAISKLQWIQLLSTLQTLQILRTLLFKAGLPKIWIGSHCVLC